MTNYSLYPDQIDSYQSLPLRVDGRHEIVAADVNRLRDAIVKIEQELGVQPSGTYATVVARLDDMDFEAIRGLITDHINDTTGAHAASAISVLDADDFFFTDDVEGALGEVASFLPGPPDYIGQDNTDMPNSGIPSFYDGYGIKFVYNTSSSGDALDKTQPSDTLRGIHIVEVDDSRNGTGYLRMTGGIGSERLAWRAPGDSLYGTSVAIDALSLGENDEIILSSSTTSKKIRVARNSESLPIIGGSATETFEVYALDAGRGAISYPSIGILNSDFITRSAITDSGTSRPQFMISGMVFPADLGTLVLQRRLRNTSVYFPISMLNLASNFSETTRTTGQKAYIPGLTNYDTVTLYDRLPVKRDYSGETTDVNGNVPFDDFENDYSKLQVAKYLIPVSNPKIVGGELEIPTAATDTELSTKLSTYRIVHYKSTSVDGYGNPGSSEIYSIYDTSVGDYNTNNTVKFCNVFVDSDTTRPNIEYVELIEPSDTTDISKCISGIEYYTGDSANTFSFRLRSANNVFANAYRREDILRFTTDVFDFPNGVSAGKWGADVDVEELLDDGYSKFSNSNVPAFSDQAFYIVDSTTSINGGDTHADRRLYITSDRFSNHAFIRATMYDPFGAGDGYDAYGHDSVHRILVNSYPTARSTASVEYFTDEYRRLSDSEEFLNTGDPDGYSYSTFDGYSVLGSGSLQVGGRFTSTEFQTPGLIYPQTNYDIGIRFRPIQQSGVDYSGYTGDRTYRRLLSLGYAITKGKIRVVSGGNSLISYNDIYHGNENRFGKIEIKIPGTGTNSTEWLDIGKLFDTGQYEDGYGAVSGAVTGDTGDFSVPFTFGLRTTFSVQDYAIAIKITYFGETSEEVARSEEKIITMIQLLPN